MKKLLSFLFMCLMATTVALAKDIKTVVVTTQLQLNCENCEM